MATQFSKPQPFDVVGGIMAYEDGSASAEEVLQLFAHLIQTGDAWTLQGAYGRAASDLIRRGMVTPHGEITDAARAILAGNEDA